MNKQLGWIQNTLKLSIIKVKFYFEWIGVSQYHSEMYTESIFMYELAIKLNN